MTIYDACLDAVDNIAREMGWEDRQDYILAVLATLHIDPDASYDEYLRDIRGFGLRLIPAYRDAQ